MKKEKQEVINLINKYNTANPFELCDLLGIHFKYTYLGSLNGYYRYSSGHHFIEINTTLDRAHQYAACAHELGHYILHQGQNSIFLNTTLLLPSKFEKQADTFALYLLLKYYDNSLENIPHRLLNIFKAENTTFHKG
nr:ImmA/IrrE family metallo-endopeptidase [uncultured Cellulosilyticum sp.]